ncbi:MAG: PQQ-binding-like beta-propeller repeat protein [Planctomycetota bacterium]|nr:PQQ-binding-like beta-propeller repeat protein [Planctomycetota bacterium]
MMVRSRGSRLAALGLVVSAAQFSWESSSYGFSDWTRFRGPNGSGIAEDKEPTPTTWSESENLKWKVPMPGAGVSCPIVVGNKVFVTCYSGYGLNQEEPGNEKDLVRHLVCVDRVNGKILWQKALPSTTPEDPYQGMGVPQHGYASHTPTSDGKNVYVFFGKSGVLAFDLDGKELWKVSVGTGSDGRQWGSSSSPIVHENVLIVPAGPEGRALIGLDKNSGKELWQLRSEKLGNVWGTPAIANVGSETELVIGAPGEIWGMDPKTGKFGWFCMYLDNGDQFSSSVVVDGETVYAIEGRGGGSVAVKGGGKDDVTDTKTVWKGRDSGRFASPIVYEGRLYNVSGRKLTCIDATTQEKIFEGRMKDSKGEMAPEQGGFGGGGFGGGGRPGGAGGPPGGGAGPGAGGPPGGGGGRQGAVGPPGGVRGGRGGGFGSIDYGSPVLADGKIYFTARNGETYVFAAGKEFNQLAVNRVTNDTEEFSATPAVSNGEIFIRSNKNLYCISTKK